MPRDQHERYIHAMHFAVIEKSLGFVLGEEFAACWASSGWMVHQTIRQLRGIPPTGRRRRLHGPSTTRRINDPHHLDDP